MNAILSQLELIRSNLARLGARRLAALGLIGLLVFVATGVSAWFLTRPNYEILYSGLDKQDVTRIGGALRESGISFDVSADGATVFVRYGQTAQARMLLAEKGLPNSSTAGYELFDKLGSLGLTSFMQEVTRVRAIEGELARTIQLIKGIKAARVHIVEGDEGTFRRGRQAPSAAVILRTEQPGDPVPAAAIRHLVAAAVPGMKADEVTIVGSDGTLVATNDDPENTAPTRLRSLERSVSDEIQDNIRKTLAPYLSVRNFQISVSARLNTDKREISETIYNPDSRVERSVRVVRENQTAQNNSGNPSTSVERNLPQDQAKASTGKISNEENQKREELTNYELSSKRITTVSGGYTIDNLSIAVLVNRAAIVASLGDRPTAEAITGRLTEIEGLVTSAAGLHRDRGDVVKVSALEFADPTKDFDPALAPGFMELAMRQTGTLLNLVGALGVAALVLFLGVKPITRILAEPQTQSDSPALLSDGMGDMSMMQDMSMGMPEMAIADPEMQFQNLSPQEHENLVESPLRVAQRRLERIIELDEERAAAILKQWIREGVAA